MADIVEIALGSYVIKTGDDEYILDTNGDIAEFELDEAQRRLFTGDYNPKEVTNGVQGT